MTLEVDEVEAWSVDDVVEWMGTIGLGHKVNVISELQVNGAALLEASSSSDKLQKNYGFSGLQAKKIKLNLPEKNTSGASSAAPYATKSSTASTAAKSSKDQVTLSKDEEVAVLREQVRDLHAQVRSLTALVEQKLSSGSTGLTTAAPDNLAVRVQIPGFCTACEIVGHATQVLQVTLGPNDTIQAEPGSLVHQ